MSSMAHDNHDDHDDHDDKNDKKITVKCAKNVRKQVYYIYDVLVSLDLAMNI